MQSTQTFNQFVHPVLHDAQFTAPIAHYLLTDAELKAIFTDAFDFHKQIPGFSVHDPDPTQYDSEEDANNINGNMHYVPHDLLCAPRPISADVNNILARDDATRIPQVRPTPTSIGSNGPALRAFLPAPFTYCIPREYLEVEGIIPKMIHEKLVDLHGIPMHPPPFFNMPDTRLYAQFISNFCQHKDAVTRRYYSKVPRNPCFPDDLRRPRIYPIKLLNQLPNHLEKYKEAFPEPLPMVIIRNDEVICMDPPRWYNMYGVIMHIPPTEHPSNFENLENPQDTLWSMSLKRGIAASYKPHSGSQLSVATSPVTFGNMIYSAEELNICQFRFPRLPGSELKEPAATYKGAFILNVIDHPMHPTCWAELSEDRKMDIYWRAPQLFGGLPTFLKCPDFPAVNLHFQNWDINMLGVLDDLKFGTVDDSIDVASARNGN
ncbi:hypothetical protein EV702DRAFT_1096610 [Suillus placidus]|uniref:Uncharacterized protein n=1 Tax=Suillus placidus TaxID=48579 RepID=A0A9P7D331_9AGAM|nr:hypothetical protein EV702DRAFT_1096610 [Suillus placidus]